ncbi:hypothetical protein BJ138DRAFT_1066661 [Hygrophoropsis aurantiaca]|uniref:Uncharacterized protein n=1 Tax=Hygrophoropsis aurantiaca TaxID=72124 RepID=A0ACB8A8T3_9AGAM|nr:hypothetical protein BJ138DRAFT_1066661 [Hygrophoropsis aurantiaca]
MFLPPEIILGILEPVYYDDLASPNYSLLSACSLVCSGWSGPAQTLLFRNPKQIRLHNSAAFYAAIDSSTFRGQTLGSCVRRLDIRTGRSSNDSCALQEFTRILLACPRLYELTLSIYGIHEFANSLLSELKESTKNLKALSLIYCGVQSPIIFQLLEIWHNVQFLKIGTEIVASTPRHDELVPSATPVVSNAPVRLYDLILLRTPSPEILSWLLEPSLESLRILECREMPGRSTRALLTPHTRRLRSLRLLHYNLDSAALLRECTELEELLLYHIPSIVPLAPDLPQTIQHFGFWNSISNHQKTLDPILDAVDSLPRLNVITCNTNVVELVDYPRLKAVCEDRNIEIIVTKVPFWIPEDPVVTRRFPRGRSVSNFGLMG